MRIPEADHNPSCPTCMFFGDVRDLEFEGVGWCAKHGTYLYEDDRETAGACAEYKLRESTPVCRSQDLAEGDAEDLFRQAEQHLNDLHRLLRTLTVRCKRDLRDEGSRAAAFSE